MTDFAYSPMFPQAADNTVYELVSTEHVEMVDLGGEQFLKVDPEALRLLAQRAFTNIAVGIGTIIFLVMSRSIATSTPQFIPLLYASILIPVAMCLWSLSATRGVATSSGQLSDELSA